jgi:hypothetical protein
MHARLVTVIMIIEVSCRHIIPGGEGSGDNDEE